MSVKNTNYKQKGITLIALIITIVILLILATVTIDVAIDGKLFDTAKDAVDRTNDRVAEEQGTIDELMNEWDKLQENTEENPNTNTGGENNNISGEGNNNEGGGGEIIDNTPPIVTVTVQGTTTNSITVNVTARDNETGMVSQPQYTYYIKEASASTYEQKTTNANSSYTYTGLTQGTTYDIKVEVNGDEAGNVGTGTTQWTTGTVTSALEEGAITFSNLTWSSGKASVTINTNTNYYIEYQQNGTSGSWTDIQNGGTISNLNHGTTIYARLTDGNNAGDYTSMDIQDKTAPTATINIDEITVESIKVTVNASDGESGLATSGRYAYYINTESTARSTGRSNTYTYTNLEGGTTYTIKVIVKDQAGNEKEIIQLATTEKEVYNATVIAQNPELYYGKEVENYGVIYDNTADASNKWRIFYADEENIYLITDDYIHADYAPDSANYEIYVNSNNYKLSFNNVYKDYTGAVDIDSTLGNKWLSAYYPSNSTSINTNIRAVAYMLDTDIWNPIYKNEYAEYAIGGPTLEMFCASYKDTHQSNYIECTANSTGYQVRWQGGSYSNYISGVPQDEYNSIYIKSDNSKADAMWLSSPSAHDPNALMIASYYRLFEQRQL